MYNHIEENEESYQIKDDNINDENNKVEFVQTTRKKNFLKNLHCVSSVSDKLKSSIAQLSKADETSSSDDESDNEDEYESVEFSEDIYNLTFLKMLNCDTVNLHYELFLKSTMTFVLQFLLVILLLQETGGTGNIKLADFTTNCSRVICGILLHMKIMPEIRGALKLMSVAKNYPEAFKGSASVAYYVCVL